MNKFTFRIILNCKYQKKDSCFPIYLRAINSRNHKDISLNLSVLKNCFDEKKQTIRKTDLQHERKNFFIQKAVTKANNILFEFDKHDKILTLSEFKRLFVNNIERKSFYSYVESELKRTIQAKSTLRGYKAKLNNLKEFRKELYFSDITVSFLKDYCNFLQSGKREKDKQEESTMYKNLDFIRTFINRAIKENIIENNPFDNFKIKKIQGNRQFLNVQEVEKLQNIYNSRILSISKQNVLKYFLFCCYTGIRFEDVKKLRFKNIDSAVYKGKTWEIADFLPEKTKKDKQNVRIPLIDKAVNLISSGLQNERIFNVISSTNRTLKEIIKEIGIDKNISFHCSRHSFATNALTYGLTIDIISKLLGHKDLRTTMIYLKYTDGTKIEQMSKFMS